MSSYGICRLPLTFNITIVFILRGNIVINRPAAVFYTHCFVLGVNDTASGRNSNSKGEVNNDLSHNNHLKEKKLKNSLSYHFYLSTVPVYFFHSLIFLLFVVWKILNRML